MNARAKIVAEVGFAFVLATALVALMYRLPVGFLRNNLHAFVAVLFLALPQLLLQRRGADIEQYGFTTEPRRLGLAVAALGVFGILPLFTLGFIAWARGACAVAPALLAGSCARVLHPALRLAPDFLLQLVAQPLVVALPEELFFRGYLQGRLEEAFPPTRRLWGAPVGAAWLLAAVLFGLGHFFVTFEPQMLTRFFPGLVFGWMFARTRSILAGTIFHASCNLLMDVLVRSYL